MKILAKSRVAASNFFSFVRNLLQKASKRKFVLVLGLSWATTLAGGMSYKTEVKLSLLRRLECFVTALHEFNFHISVVPCRKHFTRNTSFTRDYMMYTGVVYIQSCKIAIGCLCL